MARIAFIMDRIFRKFGLSGKSFIPMLIGSGCGVPGVMASRTIENDRDRKMTIMTTTLHPLRREDAHHRPDRGRAVRRRRLGGHLRVLHRRGGHHHQRHHAQEDQGCSPATPRPSSWSCPPTTRRSPATCCAACGSAAGRFIKRAGTVILRFQPS